MVSLNRKIFQIAIPSVMGFLGIIIFESVDIYWIGKIGTKAQAAIGAASFIHWSVFALMNLTAIGCMTLVGQFYGAKREQEQFRVIKESFWASLVFSLILILGLLAFSRDFFIGMGLDPQTLAYAQDYFNIFIYGLPITYLFQLQGQIFNGYGDTKISNLIMVFIIILNIIADPLLIFGFGDIPAMGTKGAALSTILAEGVGVILRYSVLLHKNYIPRFRSMFNFSTQYIRRIVEIGTPSAATNFIWCLIYPLLTTLITKFGMAPLAALNIGHRIEAFPYFFSVGFSIAISALVAQNFGAGTKEHVRQIVSRGVLLISIILSFCAVIFIFFPHHLALIFSRDPEVIRHVTDYIRTVGYFEVFLGWEIVYEGAFNGLGNGRPFMMVRIPIMLLRYPLAVFLAQEMGMGIEGVWWSVGVTTLISGCSLAFLFKVNRKNKELLDFH